MVESSVGGWENILAEDWVGIGTELAINYLLVYSPPKMTLGIKGIILKNCNIHRHEVFMFLKWIAPMTFLSYKISEEYTF